MQYIDKLKVFQKNRALGTPTSKRGAWEDLTDFNTTGNTAVSSRLPASNDSYMLNGSDSQRFYRVREYTCVNGRSFDSGEKGGCEVWHCVG